jgi:hypothetical protein
MVETRVEVDLRMNFVRRHAVRVDFEPGWDFHVIDAMRFWLEDHPEVMVG